MHHNIKDQPTGDDNGQVVGIENAEAACLDIEKGQNKTFKSLKSKKQDLSFISLEKAFQSAVGMQTISKDILKTLELFTENEGYNKAAELLADNHAFYGIDIVKFGDNINIILDRETFEHISVLDQFEKTMNMYRKYYQYEEIRGAFRKTVEIMPVEAFREAVADAIIHRTWDVDAHIRVAMYADNEKSIQRLKAENMSRCSFSKKNALW